MPYQKRINDMLVAHILFSCLALTAGLVVFARNNNRTMRALYFVSIAAAIGSSFWLGSVAAVGGSLTTFHGIAVIALVLLTTGIMLEQGTKRFGATLVSMSYVALVAAFGAHFLKYAPAAWSPIIGGMIFVGLPLVVGFSIVFWRASGLIERAKA